MMSLEQAVAADIEAKKNLVGCNRCFEHVPRDEANTAACSGCEATYDRDWNFGFLGEKLMERFAAPAAAAAAAVPAEKPCKKPCGTCGEQGHHSRQCAMYLKNLRASFPFSWAFNLITDQHSVYIYLAQACLKLTGSDQVLAQQIWDIYVWYEKQEYQVTPQVFMKTLNDWNELCLVAFALGNNLFRSNTQHFLTKKGCATWMQILKEKMGLPIWSSLNFHADSDGDGYQHEQDILHWEDFLNDVSKAFTAYTSSSREWNNSLFSRIKPFQCNKCNEIGHKSNNCPK